MSGGIQEQLGQEVMVQVPIRGYGHIVGQGYKHLKACQGLEDLHQSHGCGQEASVSHWILVPALSHKGLSIELPEHSSWFQRKCRKAGSHGASCDLVYEVAHHPFCTGSETLIGSVQSLSCVRLFAIPWVTARQASLSITNSWSSLKLLSIESVMPSSHLILCCPLFLLPPIPPSIRVFSNESTLHMRWPKYWSFSFRIIPSKEHPGLISFRMDWLDLLAVQGTLKSLLQHHSSKALILQHSAVFTVQLSHPSPQDKRSNGQMFKKGKI